MTHRFQISARTPFLWAASLVIHTLLWLSLLTFSLLLYFFQLVCPAIDLTHAKLSYFKIPIYLNTAVFSLLSLGVFWRIFRKIKIRRVLLSVVAASAVFLAFHWPASKIAEKKKLLADAPHIVIIGSDSLRADRVGAYGYERNTTPNIDQIVKESALFERVYVIPRSFI